MSFKEHRAQLEQNMVDCEVRIAKQEQVIEELKQYHQGQMVPQARLFLESLEASLKVAQNNLRILRDEIEEK